MPDILHPTLNALLNASTTVLLLCGYGAIRSRRTERHRAFMIAACATSAAFLVSYLLYHARVGAVRFEGTGWVRSIYFFILITHSALAAVIVPMVLRTLYLALRRRDEAHRRIARWTLPIWLYVSVTGVIVYVMLYRLPVS